MNRLADAPKNPRGRTPVDLSVLMCSVDTRYRTLALRMQDMLWTQYGNLPPVDQLRVEILILTDNRIMTIGAKRNLLVKAARGRYVQFVDDDDRLDDEALATVLAATASNADVITFPVMVRLGGGPARICRYSKDFGHDHNTPTGFKRLPNHICAVKRRLAQRTRFPEICMGEDADYARRLLPLLKTEHAIEKPLYFYDYDPRTSECRRR
jgi:glycosyltransferase involved in cell wall biosynthesis